LLRGQSRTDRIVTRVSKVTQALYKAQGLKHCCVYTDADRRVTFLNSVKTGSAGKGTVRYDSGR
jgi:hypothetical protein